MSILESAAFFLVTGPLALGLMPAKLANWRPKFCRQAASLTAIAAFAAAFAAFVVAITSGPSTLRVSWFSETSPFQIVFLLDSVSTLMWTLVAAIGWVICRFSGRYLSGDPNQGSYFRWTAFTLSAVTMTVLAGNLFFMAAAFLLTSVGLHHLLLHHSTPAARFPAHLKFLFSRIGDLSLVGAGLVLYQEFGTANLQELYSAISATGASASSQSDALTIAVGLLAACAIFKSAQFPFHSWLPETMEAPTPVSALMHAGIVNAGGYLLIRTAPIVTHVPSVLWAVAGIGAFTAFLAAVTMQMQTSVKRSLAWSTIAQMGFMIFQCGLGAFSAAMLHIIAHSLYKAHAFLNSGSVLTEKRATLTADVPRGSAQGIASQLVLPVMLTATIAATVCWVFDINFANKPGGLILGWILFLGIVRWNTLLLRRGIGWMVPAAIFSAGLFATYLAGFFAVDAAVAQAAGEVIGSELPVWITGTIAFVVLTVLLMETTKRDITGFRWYRTLYVHGRSGFYVDAFWRRLNRRTGIQI